MTSARLVRIIVLLTLAAALAGCSAVKLGYNTFETVAYWWLDGYVDFTSQQAPLVREDLARLHAWHRREELPKFVRLVQRMEQIAPRDLRPEEACTFVAEFRQRMLAVSDAAEPAVVALATGLQPEQLRHIEHKYEDNNRKYTKDWIELAPADRRDKRYHQFLDRAEMIYGHLGRAQRDALRADMERSSFDPEWILSQRQRRQHDLLQTLAQITQPGIGFAEARAMLRGYLARAVTPPDAQARARQDALIAQGCHNFAVLHNSTTVAQRQRAVRRLQGYERQLRELAAGQ